MPAFSTRHLVDPETALLLELLPDPPVDPASLARLRQPDPGRAALFAAEPPIAPEVRTIAGPAGPLEIYWFEPGGGGDRRAALYHIHGGGMITGSVAMMQNGPSSFAAALGIPVASVEYRLAPETPFPGPQEDCLAGLSWLVENAAALGVDPSRIAIIGESAGGGLAAATALMARDTGGPGLAAQVLIYPMLDHRTGGADCPWANRGTGEFVWTRQANQFGWASLRGDYAADDARKGWFSPSLAEDLSGLPPTLIVTGSLDLFFDEDLDYARRLVDAGVPLELHVYPGAVHAFNAVAEARIARACGRDLLGGIARLLALDGQGAQRALEAAS